MNMHDMVERLMKSLHINEDAAINLAARMYPPKDTRDLTPQGEPVDLGTQQGMDQARAQYRHDQLAGGATLAGMFGGQPQPSEADQLQRSVNDSVNRIWAQMYFANRDQFDESDEGDAEPSELEAIRNKYPGLPPHVARAYLAAAQGHPGLAYAPGNPNPLPPPPPVRVTIPSGRLDLPMAGLPYKHGRQ